MMQMQLAHVRACPDVQGDALLQRTVEVRYKQVWGFKPKRGNSAHPESQQLGMAGTDAYDGDLHIHLPANVPANGFAPDVLL